MGKKGRKIESCRRKRRRKSQLRAKVANRDLQRKGDSRVQRKSMWENSLKYIRTKGGKQVSRSPRNYSPTGSRNPTHNEKKSPTSTSQQSDESDSHMMLTIATANDNDGTANAKRTPTIDPLEEENLNNDRIAPTNKKIQRLMEELLHRSHG